MVLPEDRKYTRTHLWCVIKDDVVTLGVTARGLEEMGSPWFIELPDAEDDVLHHVAVAEIETDKDVFDIFSPVDGVVVEAHKALEDDPDKLAGDPYGNGWLVKIRMENPAQAENLLTPRQYEEFISGQG